MPRFLALLFFLILPRHSAAHPLDLGFLQVSVDGKKVEATLDLNPKAAADLLGLAENQVNQLTVQSRADKLLEATLGQGSLALGGGACRWGNARTELTLQVVRLKADADCALASSDAKWDLAFVKSPKLASTFQVMVRADSGGAEHLLIADAAKQTVEFTVGKPAGFLGSIRAYVRRVFGL